VAFQIGNTKGLKNRIEAGAAPVKCRFHAISDAGASPIPATAVSGGRARTDDYCQETGWAASLLFDPGAPDRKILDRKISDLFSPPENLCLGNTRC